SAILEEVMTPTSSDLNYVETEVRDAVRRHWVLFLLQGLTLIVFGFLAIGEPMVATIAVTLFAGWLFLIGGIVGLAGISPARRVPGFWWSLVSAVLAVVIGIYLIRRPLSGVLSLTLAAALFFGAEGIAQVITAVGQRRAFQSWGWVLVSGIANLI